MSGIAISCLEATIWMGTSALKSAPGKLRRWLRDQEP
jgi:hypothetical protein